MRIVGYMDSPVVPHTPQLNLSPFLSLDHNHRYYVELTSRSIEYPAHMLVRPAYLSLTTISDLTCRASSLFSFECDISIVSTKPELCLTALPPGVEINFKEGRPKTALKLVITAGETRTSCDFKEQDPPQWPIRL